MEETKLCPRCKRILPLDSFSKNSSRPDGLQAYCKDCQREQVQNYKQKRTVKRRERISNLENGNPKLKDFTPRQLMDELISRGYRGELIYTQKIKL